VRFQPPEQGGEAGASADRCDVEAVLHERSSIAAQRHSGIVTSRNSAAVSLCRCVTSSSAPSTPASRPPEVYPERREGSLWKFIPSAARDLWCTCATHGCWSVCASAR